MFAIARGIDIRARYGIQVANAKETLP